MENYRFVTLWDEDTNIDWQKKSRIELNAIIKFYNTWQMEYNFDADKATIVLAKIVYGKQTIGAKDGGSGYLEELEKMEEFVKSKLK